MLSHLTRSTFTPFLCDLIMNRMPVMGSKVSMGRTWALLAMAWKVVQTRITLIFDVRFLGNDEAAFNLCFGRSVCLISVLVGSFGG